MTVLIGVDPHKGSHTVVAIDGDEAVIDELRVLATVGQVDELLGWAKPLGPERGRWSPLVGSAIRCPSNWRGRGDGAGCAGHSGVVGAGVGHRPLGQRTTPTMPGRWRSPCCVPRLWPRCGPRIT